MVLLFMNSIGFDEFDLASERLFINQGSGTWRDLAVVAY